MPSSYYLPVGAIVFMTVGLILHIVGMATPKWLVCEYKGMTCHYDLWNKTVCKEDKLRSVDPYAGECTTLGGARYSAVMGLIAGIAAIGCSAFFCVMPRKIVKHIGSATQGFTTLAMEISGGIYGIGIKDDEYGDTEDKSSEKAKIDKCFSLGYSFILCLVAGFVMLIGAGIFFLSECITSKSDTSKSNTSKSNTSKSDTSKSNRSAKRETEGSEDQESTQI